MTATRTRTEARAARLATFHWRADGGWDPDEVLREPPAPVPNGNSRAGMHNRWFNTDLFGKYRDMVVNGKRVVSRAVRELTGQVALPQLPVSKVGGEVMCLSWHIKGMCNPGHCPRRHDHVWYSRSENAQLHQWYKDHYPTEWVSGQPLNGEQHVSHSNCYVLNQEDDMPSTRPDPCTTEAPDDRARLLCAPPTHSIMWTGDVPAYLRHLRTCRAFRVIRAYGRHNLRDMRCSKKVGRMIPFGRR